jgi:hypothetical protein
VPGTKRLVAGVTVGASFSRRRDNVADSADVLERLATLEGTVAVLSPRLVAVEPVSDADFLAVVATSAAGRVFNVEELVAHARVDSELRRVLRGQQGRQLGNKLRTLANRHINGYVLERVGRDEAGCIWTVLHADAGFSVETGA